MKLLDRLLAELQTKDMQENVTLTFEDGTQERMTAFDALQAILQGEPRVVSTDQPPGSLVWAMFSGETDTQGDDWPEEAREVDG